MDDNICFLPDCILNVDYACTCSFPPVYTCKMHVLNHMETPNKDHALKQIFVEPCEKTREAILHVKCDSMEDLNYKFKEEGKIQRNICIEEDLEEKSEILETSKISELEKEPKDPYSACESDSGTPEVSVTQTYLDIVSTYQQKPFLFGIMKKDKRTNLLIYNPEIESQASIILDTPQPLDRHTCITQIPNGKLFCFGNFPNSGIVLLIDENYRVQELPSGTACRLSSVIYFNNNIYCFGGWYSGNPLTLSSRFDLVRNQWNELTPMPKPDSWCNSIIFNRIILISGWLNKNLLRYSIDNNSFSTIPYEFKEKKRKILINAERLYLIECQNGSIYESEIRNDTAWRKIKNNSAIEFNPAQTYCKNNKEEIYISCMDGINNFFCFKFKLNEKRLIKLV